MIEKSKKAVKDGVDMILSVANDLEEIRNGISKTSNLIQRSFDTYPTYVFFFEPHW